MDGDQLNYLENILVRLLAKHARASQSERSLNSMLKLAATANPTAAIQIAPIELETMSLRAAEKAGVPVPHVYEVCSDESYLGGPFFVSSQVPGVSVARQILRLMAANEVTMPNTFRVK